MLSSDFLAFVPSVNFFFVGLLSSSSFPTYQRPHHFHLTVKNNCQAKYQMDQRGDLGTFQGYMDNTGMQHASRYPGSQGIPGYYYPNPYPAFPHHQSYPLQHPQSYQSQNPYHYDHRGNTQWDPYHYHQPYQSSISLPASTPIHYPTLPNPPASYQGTTFAPGFNSSPGYYLQQGFGYQQNQYQYQAEMPPVPPVPPWPPWPCSDPAQAMRVGSHWPRNSEVTVPHAMPQTTPGQVSVAAARSYRSSRPFVPTVAPFQPLSVQNGSSTNRQNPLRSESIGSQIPRMIEHVQSQRPSDEDFPALPPAQPHPPPVKEKHISKIGDISGQGKVKGRTISGDSSNPGHTKRKSKMDECSCPVSTQAVDLTLPRTKCTSLPATTVQATTITSVTRLKLDPSTSNERVAASAFCDNRSSSTSQSQLKTESNQTMDHRPISNKTATIPKNADPGYADNCATPSNIHAPPGIISSVERRLQNLGVMQVEAEIIDRLAAQQTSLSEQGTTKNERSSNTGLGVKNELWQQSHLRMNQQGSSQPETSQRLVENIHMMTSTTTSEDLLNPLQTFKAGEEYRHILSNPDHIFWRKMMLDFQTTHYGFPTADFKKQQLVSLFEMALKNLCGHIEEHSDFQDPPVSLLARDENMDSRILRHQANLIDRWGIPKWNMPGVRHSLRINRDFRNNACHVPYMGPLRATIFPPHEDLGKSAITRMDMVTSSYSANPLGSHPQRFQSPITERLVNMPSRGLPSYYWGSIDTDPERFHAGIPNQYHTSTFSDRHGNKMNQGPNYYNENTTGNCALPENSNRLELPRIIVEAWEPDQTPRPSFADCVFKS